MLVETFLLVQRRIAYWFADLQQVSTLPVGLSVLLCASCSSAAPTVTSNPFWGMFEIDGEWRENYSTVGAMAAASDFAFSGNIIEVADGELRRGDAEEDLVFEATLKVRPQQIFKGADNQQDVGVPLILPRVTSQAEFETAIDFLARNIPDERAVFFLRARSDGSYRVVNGYGICTHTSRAEVDAPLNLLAPSDGDGPFAAELSAVGAIDALENMLANLR